MLKEPDSMDECIYFTNRAIGEDFSGNARCWVFKEKCPKCKKAMMGKPIVDGKVKIRALEYVCPSCNYSEEKQQYEDKLTANIDYICPKCKNHGQTQMLFKRKRVQGVLTLRFECEKCHETLDVTKKMKAFKKKKVVEDADIDDE
jgi:DNA-directed RNA polymerase subunit M/transcription elongation factor TFIIS